MNHLRLSLLTSYSAHTTLFLLALYLEIPILFDKTLILRNLKHLQDLVVISAANSTHILGHLF